MSELPIDQIVCGDNCDTLAGFPAECIDLVVTSPPYDDLRTYGGHSWDFEHLAGELWRTIKPGGVVVWIVADQTIDGSETGESFRQALRFKDVGFRLHDTMIYERQGSKPDPTRYWQNFEFVFVVSKGKPSSINLIADSPNVTGGQKATRVKGERQANGDFGSTPSVVRYRNKVGVRGNIWRYKVGGGNSTRDAVAFNHPAIFPEALARDHILSWSNEGDLVVDPFAGSFTTCKMARLAGRHWIGIEVNPEYCEIGRKRMSEPLLPFMEATDEPPPPATARELFDTA